MFLRLQQKEGMDGRWLQARAMRLGDSAWKMVILPSEGIGWSSRPYTTQACLNGWFYIVDCVKLDKETWTRMDFVLNDETETTLKLCEMRGITANGYDRCGHEWSVSEGSAGH